MLITGASFGFGKITTQVLSGQNHIAYGTSRKLLESTGKIQMLIVDVTSSISVCQAAEQIISEQKRMDVLVNNAGMGIGEALELATEEEVSMQMNTNSFGVVNICKAVLPYMRRARRGKVINISSIGGVMGIPCQRFYSALKLTIEGYNRASVLEAHPFYIKVCLAQPEDFNTGFTDNRNISELTGQNEDYVGSFLRSLRIIEKKERNGCYPRRLDATVCKVVVRKNPPFRIKVGPSVQILFVKSRNWLSDNMMQYTLRIFYAIR